MSNIREQQLAAAEKYKLALETAFTLESDEEYHRSAGAAWEELVESLLSITISEPRNIVTDDGKKAMRDFQIAMTKAVVPEIVEIQRKREESYNAIKDTQLNSNLTTDENDERLNRSKTIGGQNEAYLILSEEERAKGFVRPVHRSYTHVGIRPKYELRELTEEQHERYDKYDYVAYEAYPPSSHLLGRFWTQAQLDKKACLQETTMALELCESYARNPKFYGRTYCSTCYGHYPVGEFIWPDGTTVGS